MKSKKSYAIFSAFFAAVLYAISSPISKLLLEKIPSAMMAAFLYLGAGIGVFFVGIIHKKISHTKEKLSLTKKELPFVVGMVILDIAAPILLMIGLSMTTAANASLLNNFEIVATSIIALMIFKESISKRLWIAIGFVTVASIILSFENISSFSFSFGSIFVLFACICWGFENNCTRMLSSRNPLQIVVIKGLGSGVGSLIIALILGESVDNLLYVCIALILGFISYGLSISFYIYAQRYLGAAKTSTYYGITPFIGAILSLFIFKEIPSLSFIIALLIMAIGTYFASTSEKRRI